MSSPGFRGMMRVWLIVATVCSIATSVKAEDLCREPEKKDRRVVIDGNTGFRRSGEDFYPRGTQLEIVIYKNNPFKYAYSHSIDVQPIDERGAILALFSLLYPLKDVTDPNTGIAQIRPAFTQGNCPQRESDLLQSIRGDLSNARTSWNDLAGRVKQLSTQYAANETEYNDFIQLTAGEDPDCPLVVTEARQVKQQLGGFSLGTLSKEIANLSGDLDKLVLILNRFNPSPECQMIHEGILEDATKYKTETSKLSSNVETMAKGAKSFTDLSDLIDKVLVADGFTETRSVGGSRKPSVVTVTVKRTSLRDKDAEPKTVETEIQIGHPRFALGVGLGVSWIPEQEFEQVDSLVPDGMGGQMAGKRFELVDESDPTPLGAVLLHANVGRWSKKHDIPLALSVGVSIGDDDEAARYGYLFGLSGGFLDRMFYITAAYHLREVDRLGGGFDDGDVVPSGISGVPLREETESDVMIAFTYNVLEPKGK